MNTKITSLFAVLSLSLMSACEGTSALVRVTQVPYGSDCEYGGVKIETGQDLDGNDVLTADEVRESEYLCNQRVDGKTSLVEVSAAPKGGVCETGGQRIDFGVDHNNDKVLQPEEINSTRYVCNGRAHLTKIESIDESAQCVAGGVRVQTGFDTNGDSFLAASEVQRTEYVCHGEDGADGFTTVVRYSDITAAPQSECFFGGTRIESGLDLNRNGKLDDDEVATSQNICAVQVNAHMTLVKNSAVLPGSVCEYGGVKMEVGIDDNDNHVLEDSEVDSTSVHCSSVIIVDGLTTLVDTVPATPAQCAFGGVVLRSGLDDNRDGVLQTQEFDAVEVICNGANGYDGVTATAPYTGSQCVSGSGFKVTSGLDLNRNGTLDAAEVKNTAYVCHGAAGQAGTNALVRTSDAGSVCGVYGGAKFESGMDNNHNGTLDSAEVSSTAYVCNGYDGYNAAVSTDEGYWYACGGGWGIRVRSGLDYNGNGWLDGNEVQYENYLCE